MRANRPSGLLEVVDFWLALSLAGDPEAFWYHHEAGGWRIGKGTGRPIRDWKMAAQLWSRNAQRRANERPKGFDPNVGRPLPPEERGE